MRFFRLHHEVGCSFRSEVADSATSKRWFMFKIIFLIRNFFLILQYIFSQCTYIIFLTRCIVYILIFFPATHYRSFACIYFTLFKIKEYRSRLYPQKWKWRIIFFFQNWLVSTAIFSHLTHLLQSIVFKGNGKL